MSAGEVSGDHYIARVANRLRDRGYDGRICGLCGAEARSAGVEGLWNAERLQLMGVSEVLGSLRDILSLKREMQRAIVRQNPAVLVLADSPDFHLPLMRALRRAGYAGKIFYISPPSVWAWRSYRVRDLKHCVDENLPLFKFEHDYLARAGCNSYWVGHPLVEEFESFRPDRARIVSQICGASSDDRIVALLPGSRRSEVEMLYPVLSGLYASLEEAGFAPVFSVAPGLSESAATFLGSRLEAAGERRYDGPGRDLMVVSEAVVGSSGTATAQALLLRRYMVVLYKLRPLSAFIGKILLRHLFFAVPNLLAGEMFYPELLQENATPEAAFDAAMRWLRGSPEDRSRALSKMEGLAALMGKAGVCDFWADRILAAVN
ncbi:lipid-A-disaccharide synthase [Synergistaceae bacterium OttesenSCG-928-I11]|nr:lipid-A-disaccharide synthase [Synergistaceae bacterium OttesenSCG-928-I11]